MNTRKASKGMWLTQATIESEESRAFATEVCGYGDLDALFIEWTDAQKTEWEEEHKSEEYATPSSLDSNDGPLEQTF